jgi:hypothetical protein
MTRKYLNLKTYKIEKGQAANLTHSEKNNSALKANSKQIRQIK